MDFLYLIGRILFGLIFVLSGLNHLASLEATAQYAGAKGMPAPKAMAALSGVAILLGGLSVIFGLLMEIGTWLLVVFLIPAAFTMHAFWKETDPGARQTEQAHFMKNLSMAGAALILYWLVQVAGYGPMTMGEPLG